MLEIIIILTGLFFSAFFSGVEIAYISSSKLKIEILKQGFGRGFHFFLTPFQRTSKFFSTVLIGNNIALIVFSLFFSASIIQQLQKIFVVESTWVSFLIETVFCTGIIIVFGEYLPKVFSRIAPNKVLVYASPVLFFTYVFLYPLVLLVEFIANFLVKFFLKEKNIEQDGPFRNIEIIKFLEEAEQVHEKEDADNINILKNTIDFDKVKVRDCMVPRNEIITIDVKEKKDVIATTFETTGHSRLPVYEAQKIIGYLHFYEFYKFPDSDIKSIIFSMPSFHEAMKANEVLKRFIRQKKNMAMVFNEYDDISGLITMEDILEEITGDIYDEYDDVPSYLEEKIDDYTYRFSARHEIEYLNREYSLDIPESKIYRTLSGYIITKSEKIPEKNESIEIGPFQITIDEIKGGRINTVTLKTATKIDKNQP